MVTGLLITLFVVTPTATATPHRARTQAHPAGFYVVGWKGQDFATRVAKSVASAPTSRKSAQEGVARLLRSAQAGRDVNLVGSPGDASHDVKSLQSAQSTLALQARRDSSSTPDASNSPASGPTTFELRGLAINSNRTWEVKTELDGAFCSSDCETTDIIRQTWKITPQRNVDVFAFTSTYVRNAHNFNNIYADGFVLCGGSECARSAIGDGGARDGTGSGSEGIKHPSQAVKKTVDRLRLQATFKPNATRYYDGVHTGTARCGSGSKMYCAS